MEHKETFVCLRAFRWASEKCEQCKDYHPTNTDRGVNRLMLLIEVKVRDVLGGF